MIQNLFRIYFKREKKQREELINKMPAYIYTYYHYFETILCNKKIYILRLNDASF